MGKLFQSTMASLLPPEETVFGPGAAPGLTAKHCAGRARPCSVSEAAQGAAPELHPPHLLHKHTEVLVHVLLNRGRCAPPKRLPAVGAARLPVACRRPMAGRVAGPSSASTSTGVGTLSSLSPRNPNRSAACPSSSLIL